MKFLSILSAIILLIVQTGFSQKKPAGTLTGKIMDSTAKQAMADATVAVLHTTDSTSVAYTLADAKGNFEIKNIELGSYRLLVSFQGYRNISKPFSLSTANPSIDFGILFMDPKTVLLDEVVVERPPITVRNDTVEFNAGAFKTKPNASVEDLLKKLPGVQVDRDGAIKAQGEQVQKVYVDGKEFFGNDPKLATKNLTADMVESVQVYDDMSDQAKFTKIDDGSRQKTINIKLKKDKKKGLFGKANLGAGSDGRYDNNLSFNRFKGNQQVSLIAAGNNVNKQGFALSDIISTMGGMGSRNGGVSSGNDGGGGAAFGGGGGQMTSTTRTGGSTGNNSPFGIGSGSQGNTTSWSTGLNYRDSWSKKVEVSGSYFYANTLNELDQKKFRQSFFPNDSIALQTTDSYNKNNNQNHKFNFRLEWQIDSLNSILYTPGIIYQRSDSYSNDDLFSQSTSPKFDYLALTGRNVNNTNRDGITVNNNLLYRRKLNKIGRTFTLGLNSSIKNSNGNGLNQSDYTFFNPDTSVKSLQDIDQQTDQNTRANNTVLSSSYTEPIGKNKIVEINYAYTNNQSTSDRKALDFNPASNEYDILNKQLTNFFENAFIANRIGANFRLQQKKYNFQAGGAIQFATQESISLRAVTGKDSVTTQHFINFFPTANYNHNYGRGKNLRINYRGRTNAPTITQLQDVPDITNPLLIRTGNPNLKQEFNNNLNGNFNTFNLATAKFMAFNVNLGNTNNKIANNIDTLSRQVQITKPENVDGVYNGSAFATFGLPIKKKKLKGAMVNLTTALVYNRDVSLVYKKKNIGNTWLVTQTAGFNYNYKDKLDFGVNATVSYNNTRYTVQQNLNNRYWAQTYSLDFSYMFPKNIIIATDFDYFVNSGRTDGFNQNIPMWNASISKQVLKKKNGEIKLAVIDVLNQNKSINRNIGENYIEDTRTNILQRFFMVSFIYNLNKMAGNSNMFMPKMFRKNMDNIRINN